MGLASAGCQVEIREVKLQNKPAEMLTTSRKGTVPVLVKPDGSVLDESLDILMWSLSLSDPDGWLDYPPEKLSAMAQLVDKNDNSFKVHLDHYKYSVRYPEESMEAYRMRAEVFLNILEDRLTNAPCLFGQKLSYADIAILPFIRQFSNVEPEWFQSSHYSNIKSWLGNFLASTIFKSIMTRYTPWQAGDPPIMLLVNG